MFLTWDSDLRLGPSGDLQLANGIDLATQSIMRRLMTNPQLNGITGSTGIPGYFFDPAYGIGLGVMVDAPFGSAQVKTLRQIVLQGIQQEPSISSPPPPIVQVTQYPGNLVKLVCSFSTVASGTGYIGLKLSS